MEIKKSIVEKLIQESLDDVKKSSLLCEERFVIHAEGGVEVQVVVTSDVNEFLGYMPDELEG